MKGSLRGRFLKLAHEIQGADLPIHFRESNEDRAALAAGVLHWAQMAHHRARMALLDFNIKRLSNV